MPHAPHPEPSAGSWRREPQTQIRPVGLMPAAGPDGAVITVDMETPETPLEWEPHTHAHHELVWGRDGSLTSRVGEQLFTVSDGYALWLPAGAAHSGRLTARAKFVSAFFHPEHTPHPFTEPTVVALTPVLEALLHRLADPTLDAGQRARAEAVVFDELTPSPTQLALRMPGDSVIDPIAAALLDDPADERGLTEWALHLGMSERTIGRAFRRSTGLSFAQWRQALRVHHAVALLADGIDVQHASEQLGYAQPSTFIAAFRRVLGTTPGAFANRG